MQAIYIRIYVYICIENDEKIQYIFTINFQNVSSQGCERSLSYKFSLEQRCSL